MKNPQEVINLIVDFIKCNLAETNGAVVGLSGGIDSSLVAVLSWEALGKDKITGLILPYFYNEDTADVEELAFNLGINYKIVSITEPVNSISRLLGLKDTITEQGNLMARERMAILYAYANKYSKRVLGTTNLTEKLIGYGTKYGDEAADHEPIAGLLKKYIYELSYYWNTLDGKPKIPEQILTKAPSAGLKKGQTDEKDLKMTYAEIDKILECVLINKLGGSLTKSCDKGYYRYDTTRYLNTLNQNMLKSESSKKVVGMMLTSDHKRRGSNYPTIPVTLLKK